MNDEFEYKEYPQKGQHQFGPWGPSDDPNLKCKWQLRRELLESAPGLTIFSVHNTEPICRVSGYMQPVVENARLIAAAPDMLEVLEYLWSEIPLRGLANKKVCNAIDKAKHGGVE